MYRAETEKRRASVEREIIWVAWEGPGLEHLRLAPWGEGIAADGLLVGMDGNHPFRARYEIRCDAGWRVREVRVAAPDSDRTGVDLLADGEGYWTTRSGDSLPELDGCVDVDISATPFTNTLPIRRLGLQPGESAELDVAFFDAPKLRVGPEKQRYGRLEARDDGGLYRFEALPSGFTAELPVDADGLVIDYPGLFRRAWSG
jgi:hypothetical protein